jgi:hypothetical protein
MYLQYHHLTLYKGVFMGPVNPEPNHDHVSEINKYNIDFLNQNKTKRFDFDSEGKIFAMNPLQRAIYSIKSFFTPSEHDRIKAQFNNFIKSITVKDQNEEEKKNITKFFFNTIPDLSRSFYDRDIDKSTIEHLQKEIESVIEADVGPAEAENIPSEGLVDQESPIARPEEPRQPAPRSVASVAKLWAKLGNYSTSDSGSSISYRVVEGGTGTILGIFKASSEEPLGEKNTKLGQRIKKLALNLMPASKVGSLNETAAGQGFVAEVVSKRVADRLLNIVASYEEMLISSGSITADQKKVFALIKKGLVPNTEVVKFELGNRSGEVGSFQEWIHEDHDEAYKFLGLKNKDYKGLAQQKSTIPPEMIDLLAIMDYATGNSDRHGENWFVMTDKNGDPQSRVSGIRLIDGGWSMAPRHPLSGAIELGNQYKWRNQPFANRPFTEMGKFIIKELHAQKEALKTELKGLYDAHLTDRNDVKVLTPQRIIAMDDRLKVMNNMTDGTLKDLANVRTQEEIATQLKHPHIPNPG